MYPPGHFYSPIPSPDEVRRDEARIYAPPPRTLPGIDLREPAQLALLEALLPYYAQLPFPEQPAPGFRYHYENGAYSYSDGIFLHCMLRHLRPSRVIEVGSGYSSALMLDTRERFFAQPLELTFIEPFPETLRSLMKEGDARDTRVLEARLQDVPPTEFDRLKAGDILFVDSTHVAKVGSDVNRLIFEILPRLASGVHVHFHDVFYPFEYPRAWVDAGIAWNEQYLLRAFLQYNDAFRVVLMNTFLEYFHEELFRQKMPLCLRNWGGSLWIRRA